MSTGLLDSVRRSDFSGGILAVGLAAAVAWVYLPLFGISGYFSSDELQWGAFSNVDWAALPWVSFVDVGTFQYRPLTFNLWLIISWALFDHPIWFHALWLVLAAVNGVLLLGLMLRAGAQQDVATAGAALFLVVPYAVYVHGWVATLADLLVLAFGLQLARVALGKASTVALAIAGFVLTTAALLAKESAVSLPALLALGATAAHGATRRRLAIAALAALVAAFGYLLLRVPSLLATSSATTGYGMDFWGAPLRLVHYLMFPFITPPFEVNGAFGRWAIGKFVLVFGAVLGLLTLSLGLRRAAWLLLALAAAFGPVLVIAREANQYGYLAAAVLGPMLAMAWYARPRWPFRLATGLLTLLLIIHGQRTAVNLAMAAEVQQRFYEGLVTRLSDPAVNELRVRVDCPGQRWLFERLMHEIPAYRGIPMGPRLQLAELPGDSTDVASCSGELSRERAQ